MLIVTNQTQMIFDQNNSKQYYRVARPHGFPLTELQSEREIKNPVGTGFWKKLAK
jgi:hypothetical protein